MKKCLIYTLIAIFSIGILSSCKKTCNCNVTYTTPTQNITQSYEMGKLTEDDCAQYQGTVIDGEGVTRIFDCKVN